MRRILSVLSFSIGIVFTRSLVYIIREIYYVVGLYRGKDLERTNSRVHIFKREIPVLVLFVYHILVVVFCLSGLATLFYLYAGGFLSI